MLSEKDKIKENPLNPISDEKKAINQQQKKVKIYKWNFDKSCQEIEN